MPFVSLSVQVHHEPDAASVTTFTTPIELCRSCATKPLLLRVGRIIPTSVTITELADGGVGLVLNLDGERN